MHFIDGRDKIIFGRLRQFHSQIRLTTIAKDNSIDPLQDKVARME
jgi:hypothetical protein